MARIAGDNPGYTFTLTRADGRPTEWSFDLPSVTTIIGDVLGKPAGAMAWWGYRLGLEGVTRIGADVVLENLASGEALEAALREEGIDPNKATSKAGDRGTFAHDVLEFLTQGHRDWAEDCARYEERGTGAKYCWAVISWWDAFTQGWEADHESGKLFPHPNVVSERPVWSLRDGYCGTLDLAVQSFGTWELLDLKTHKPASGFTKPGQGPAYLSDLIQIRAYRKAWEEMGLGDTGGQRVVIARENGTWLEDRRQVPKELWLSVLETYRLMQAFKED